MVKKNRNKDDLIEEIKALSLSNGLNTVFTTFLEITATSIAAHMDPRNAKEREKRYQAIASKLTPKELSSYTRMFALLSLAVRDYADDPCDILGDVYHQLNLNNKWNGQFFTPDNISRLMAQITINDMTPSEDGPVTICEPACGSGTMVIGTIWSMLRKGIDYRHKTFFMAQDVDIRCVWMAYIQLSLYEIPAVVIHGNTLTMEEWSRWYTPCAAVPFPKGQIKPTNNKSD